MFSFTYHLPTFGLYPVLGQSHIIWLVTIICPQNAWLLKLKLHWWNWSHCIQLYPTIYCTHTHEISIYPMISAAVFQRSLLDSIDRSLGVGGIWDHVQQQEMSSTFHQSTDLAVGELKLPRQSVSTEYTDIKHNMFISIIIYIYIYMYVIWYACMYIHTHHIMYIVYIYIYIT